MRDFNRSLQMKKTASIAAILCVAAVTFCGCNARFSLYDAVEDYGKYLDGLKQVSEKYEEKSPTVDISVAGYTRLSDIGFDGYADFGENSYALCFLNGEKVIIDKAANIVSRPIDAVKVNDFGYVYFDGNKFGWKTLGGDTVLNAEYRSIDAVGNTLIARTDKTVFVFKGNKLIRAVSSENEILPYSEGVVICNGVLSDPELRPIKFGGYRAVDMDASFAVVCSEEGKFGYYDRRENRLLCAPQYVSASLFSNGFATVVEHFDGEYSVINDSGEIKATFEKRPYGFYDWYMFVYDEIYGLSLLDADFQDTGLRFSDAYGKRVYGKYVVDSSVGRIFSLEKREYVGEVFESIIPTDGGFICSKSSGDILYDGNLNECGIFEEIYFSGGIISVKKSGKFYFFRKT